MKVDATNTPKNIPRDVSSIADQFTAFVKEWKSACGPTSSAVRMAQIPAYQKIIAMGQAAVPLLLVELERDPDHWFIALHAITGVDPVPKESRGRLQEMAAAWLRWGREINLKKSVVEA